MLSGISDKEPLHHCYSVWEIKYQIANYCQLINESYAIQVKKCVWWGMVFMFLFYIFLNFEGNGSWYQMVLQVNAIQNVMFNN